jgi:glyoxylase I family protein
MAIKAEGLCPLVQVFDMPRAVRFYCELLGFEFVSRSPTYATENGVELFHWAWLRRGGAELMLNTAYDEGERPEVPDAVRVRTHEDTSFYFGCGDLDTAYVEVQAFGVKCGLPTVAPYGMRQLSFKDPDGYGIVLQHRVRT